MNTILDVAVPFLPPSTNALYANVRGRGRVKTTVYEKFVNEVSLFFMNTLTGNEPVANGGKGHALVITVFLPNMFTVSKKAASRFTAFDASNRLKPIEDAIVRLVGIDDKCFVDTSIRKRKGPEGFHVALIELEDDDFISDQG